MTAYKKLFHSHGLAVLFLFCARAIPSEDDKLPGADRRSGGYSGSRWRGSAAAVFEQGYLGEVWDLCGDDFAV